MKNVLIWLMEVAAICAGNSLGIAIEFDPEVCSGTMLLSCNPLNPKIKDKSFYVEVVHSGRENYLCAYKLNGGEAESEPSFIAMTNVKVAPLDGLMNLTLRDPKFKDVGVLHVDWAHPERVRRLVHKDLKMVLGKCEIPQNRRSNHSGESRGRPAKGESH